MHTPISGKIRVVSEGKDDKVVLVIARNDFEEFKKYEHSTDSNRFFADFSLYDKQFYIIGLFTEIEKKGNTVTMSILSANKEANGSALTRPEDIQALLGFSNKKKEIDVEMLKRPRKQIEELKLGVQELETANKKAENEKQALETANKEANQALETKTQELETKNTEAAKLQTDLKAKEKEIAQLKQQQPNAEVDKLKADLTAKEKEVETLQQEKEAFKAHNPGLVNLQQLLKEKEEKIEKLNDKVELLKNGLEEKFNEVASLKKDLQAQNSQVQQLTQKNKKLEAEKNKAEQEKQNLEAEKNKAEAQITTLNTEVESLKKDLQAQNSQVQQLTQKNKELEDKSKTIEQPKQSNGARYTATVGMGLAAGLIAFTALERTVRLEMLVMIGIAVTSALVVGGITYAVLPGTQVDGAKAQEVNENGKGK